MNEASLLLPDPVTMDTSTEVLCAVPEILIIRSASKWLLSPGTHPLSMEALTIKSQPFHNFSSFTSAWSSTRGSITPSGLNTTLTIASATLGSITVTASLTRLSRRIQSQEHFELRSNHRLTRDRLLLIMNPANVQRVGILDGSGDFDVSSGSVVGLKYDEVSREVQI